MTAATKPPPSVAYATEIPLSETAAPASVFVALNIVPKANGSTANDFAAAQDEEPGQRR